MESKELAVTYKLLAFDQNNMMDRMPAPLHGDPRA